VQLWELHRPVDEERKSPGAGGEVAREATAVRATAGKMSSKERTTWKTSTVVVAVAVAFNFPWEMLQAPLYRMETGGWPLWLHCLRASLGDGLLVLLIFVLGVWILRRQDWFRRPGGPGYAWMLVSGAIFAAALEWTAVHLLKRWSYEPAMPMLPGLGIGLVPIAQMLVLPPAIFAVAARLRSFGMRPAS
jgi:hypothetical protein